MTLEEWESLCDGCGRCCLVKLENAVTGKVIYTGVSCRYLDPETCGCTVYHQRNSVVRTCQILTPDCMDDVKWLPDSCAYRLLAEGRDLPWWHHLVSGSRRTVHEAGMSVRHRSVSERFVQKDDLRDYVYPDDG